MALSDEVLSRYSTQFLRKITNTGGPDATPAGTVNTVILDLASTDAQNYFEVYASTEYDNSNATHVAFAVPVVIIMLKVYSGILREDKALKDIESRLKSAGRILNASKVEPLTSSEDTIESGLTNGVAEVFPEFRDKSFDDIVPDRPGG